MTGKRDYLFDNIKGLIIFLVVWEHLLGETIRSGSVAGDLLCTAILMFHMSVMMFVSGYFTKDLGKANMENNIRKILVPYVVICTLVGLYQLAVNGVFKPSYFKPSFAMWYIVVLFFYRLALPYMVRVRFALPLSFVLALLSGMLSSIETYPTLGRLLSNLPFFLAGYYCNPQAVYGLRSKMKKPEQAIMLAAFLILTLGTAGLAMENQWDANVYRNNTTYAAAGMSNLLGIECRVLFYLIGLFAVVCYLICTSRKKTFLCKVGKNSMVIYFFHIFVYEEVVRRQLFDAPTWHNFFWVTGISLVTVWILSWNIWSRLFNGICGLICWIFFKQQTGPEDEESQGNW